jgi:molybdate transport system permease protein
MDNDWFPLWLSLRVAALSTTLALALGLAVAWLLAYRNLRGKQWLDSVLMLPLVMPPTVLGYFLLVLIGRESWFGRAWESLFGSPLVFTPTAAVLAALVHAAPLLIVSTRAALESVDPVYEKAARSLGASEFRAFFRVVLPLAWRSIFAATILAFARSIGDFGITLMIAGNIPGRTQTVAVAIYDAVESGNGQTARVLVLVVSVLILLILAAANRLGSAFLPLRSHAR